VKENNELKLKIAKIFILIFIAVILNGILLIIISQFVKNRLLFYYGLFLIIPGFQVLILYDLFSRSIDEKIIDIIEKNIKGKDIKKESGQLTLDENNIKSGNLSIKKTKWTIIQ